MVSGREERITLNRKQATTQYGTEERLCREFSSERSGRRPLLAVLDHSPNLTLAFKLQSRSR